MPVLDRNRHFETVIPIEERSGWMDRVGVDVAPGLTDNDPLQAALPHLPEMPCSARTTPLNDPRQGGAL